MIYRRNPNPTRVTPRARRHLHSLSPSAPYSLSALLPQSPHRRRPSKVVTDPSPRGAGPSSRTATRAGAPPPDVGPPPVVHPSAALLQISWRPQAAMNIVTMNYTIFWSLVHRRRQLIFITVQCPVHATYP
jgi:hypothetical protein